MPHHQIVFAYAPRLPLQFSDTVAFEFVSLSVHLLLGHTYYQKVRTLEKMGSTLIEVRPLTHQRAAGIRPRLKRKTVTRPPTQTSCPQPSPNHPLITHTHRPIPAPITHAPHTHPVTQSLPYPPTHPRGTHPPTHPRTQCVPRI